MRSWLVLLHRYVGLVIAGFLVIAGLTGALLVWYPELDRALNPRLMRVEPPGPQARPLSPLTLRERVQAAFPEASVNWLVLTPPSATAPALFYIDPAPSTLKMDEVYVNPYSGEILGGRRWGDLSQGITNLMPFIYRFHNTLALGTIGTWIFGIVALLWTADCFVGAWLTFPRKGRAPNRRQSSRARRWLSAWKIRWRNGYAKLSFDLHRVGGLWPWALLVVFAWSGVAMTLYDELYRPATSAFMTFQEDPLTQLPNREVSSREPEIGWESGLLAARSEMQKLAKERGFHINALERFAYYPHKRVFKLMASTDRDINQRFGQTWLYIDSRTGERIGFYLPTGEASGDTFTTWITTLHIAAIGGLPFRILVTLLGLIIVLLSATGVILWWRRKIARDQSRKHKNSLAGT